MKNLLLFLVCCFASISAWSQSGIPFLTSRDNFCTSSGTFQGNWQLIGPKSLANQNMGRIDPVWVDPSDTSHLLAGSLSGGLFEKIPGTMTWRPLTDKLPGIGVHDIAVHKDGSNWNQATIVISTQTGVNDPERWYGLGIYYSTDGGQHWTFDEEFYEAAGKGTPVVPRTRFLHGTDGLISIVNHKILRKTSLSDPQSQWEDITPVGLPANSDLFDLEMSPTDADVFWVAGSNEPGDTTGAVLLYTLDGGDNFTNITSTCPGATFFNVALPANNHAFVYYYNATTAKINHYVQSGGTYVLQPNPTTPNKQGIWFEVSRIDLDEMYFGTSATSAFHRWNDSTHTLSSAISTLHADVRYILASDSGDVYVGDDGGVSRSKANGAAGSWQNLNGEGLAVSQIYGLSGVEERPALLYGGAQDNYTWRAEDGVFSFLYASYDGYETESYQKSPPPNDTIIVFFQRGPGYGTNGTSGEHVAELYRKTDGSPDNSATQITPHQGLDPERFSKPIYKSPVTGRFYVGQNDLYWSDDDGDNYPYVAGLSAGGFNNNQNAVSAFDVSQQDENRIYVAYNASGDYQGNQQYRRQLYFNDEADGWLSISPSLLSNPNTDICSDYLTCFQQITGVVSDPKNYNRVWITLSDRWTNFERDPNDWFSLKPYRESAVYYSDSSGLPGTWHAMSTGLPNFYVHCIVYQKGTDDVLYVGTDAGVFRWAHSQGEAAWVGTWQCFSEGLPACVVKDLEINYCAGKLRAASYGRGFWESDLYMQSILAPRTQTTATWNTDRTEIQSFTITQNQTLTISGCTVSMAANTYIKVEPGGTLILDGATLTNTCGYMWSGIQVVGNPALKQTPTSNQGLLVLKNGAHIEHAYVGAMADEASYSAPDYTFPNGSGIKGGGIIQVQFNQGISCHIVNCRNGIGFGPYHSPPVNGIEPVNKSYIRGCVLENTGALHPPYDNGYTNQHLSMWNVHGIALRGNTFSGPQGVKQAVAKVKGIVSIDADYTVDDYCLSQNVPCSNVRHTVFNDLYRGIYSTITDPGAAARLLKVANCSFNDVRRSVYLCGHQNADVIFNTIALNETKNDTAYGIYTNGCTFYTIEENTITGPSPLPLLSYGIIINNSVGANNENDDNLVYRNWLNNLQYGTVSMRRNANSGNGGSTPHGLEFRCNQYNNVSYAIAVFAPLPGTQNATIKHKQGDTNDPAANKFEISTAQWSLWKSSIPTPTYYHHNVASYDPSNPGTHVSNFVLVNTNSTEVSCPSHFDEGGGEGQKVAGLSSGQIKSQIEAYERSADSLAGLIDGGNTAELISKANDVSITSEQLKTELLAVGPFLSDTVLNVSLTRSNPMKNSDTKEVIMINSPVEDTVYSVLEAEKPVVAANIAVVNAQEGVSDRSNLIAEAGNLYLQSYLALHTLRDYYEESDSVNAFYQYLLEQDKNQYAIAYAFQLGDNGNAQAMISQMDESDLKSWYQLALDKKTSGTSLTQVATEELNWVKSIAGEESISGLLALNLLTLIEGSDYYEDFPMIDEAEPAGQKVQQAAYHPTLQHMQASPNPANGNVTIQFSPAFESKGAQLVLTDVFGKQMQSIVINDDFSTVPISLAGLPSGIYLLQLKSDGMLLVTEKIIVE